MSAPWFRNQNMHSDGNSGGGQRFNQGIGSLMGPNFFPMPPNFSQPPPFSFNRPPMPSPQPPLPMEPPPRQPPPPPPPPGVDWVPFKPKSFNPNWNSSPHPGPRHRNPHAHNNHRFPYNQQNNAKKRRFDSIDDGLLPRKKPMSKNYPTKPWNERDAEKAELAEATLVKKNEQLILKVQFPEKDITADMVQTLHPAIDSVHFQVPGSARYCFVQINKNAAAEAVIEELNKTNFYGQGLLSCERKITKALSADHMNNDKIDPYTLYLGNLPLDLASSALKNTFQYAQRVDIGYAQRMKCTRYAFIRFPTVEAAIAAFKHALTLRFDSRSLIVRFRRQKSKEPQVKTPDVKDHRQLAITNSTNTDQQLVTSTSSSSRIDTDEPVRVRKDGSLWPETSSSHRKRALEDDDLSLSSHQIKKERLESQEEEITSVCEITEGSLWSTDNTGRNNRVLRDEDLTNETLFDSDRIKQEPLDEDVQQDPEPPVHVQKGGSAWTESSGRTIRVLGDEDLLNNELFPNNHVKEEPADEEDEEGNFSDESDYAFATQMIQSSQSTSAEYHYMSESEPEHDDDSSTESEKMILPQIKQEAAEEEQIVLQAIQSKEQVESNKSVLTDDDVF